MLKKISLIMLVLLLLAYASLTAAAQKSGMQIKAVEGNQSEWIFNGALRVWLDSIKLEKEKKTYDLLVTKIRVKNGTSKSTYVHFRETYLANNEGDSFSGTADNGYFKLLPGAAKVVKLKFRVDKGFSPTKLVTSIKTNKQLGSFRIWLNASAAGE